MNQEKIGKFILNLRKEKNLTQSDIAEKLGVTNRSVSNWENGKCMPDLSLFKPLCEILDISINELMSGERIDNENYQDKLEENIINAIDEKNKKFDRTGYLVFNSLGIIVFILSCLSWSMPGNFQIVGALFGILFIVMSLNKIIIKKSIKVVVNIFISLILIFTLVLIDYQMTDDIHKPKIYLKKYVKDNITIYYKPLIDSPIYCDNKLSGSIDRNVKITKEVINTIKLCENQTSN